MSPFVRTLVGAALLLETVLLNVPSAVAGAEAPRTPTRSPITLALAAQDAPTPRREAPGAKAKAKPKTAADLLDEAQKVARGGDLEGAVKRIDEALALEPTNRQALYLGAALREEIASAGERPKSNALFRKAAALMRQLRAAHKDLDESETFLYQATLYNEACTLTAERNPDKALDVLAEAVAGGFNQIETLDADKELDPLRKLPRFQELRAKLEAQVVALAREHARTALAENKPFPFDFKLPDTAGKTVKRADFAGKVTLVDVWGTWCPPCRMEIPHFIKLYEKYRDRGLEIVGLNYEQVPEEKVKATIQAFVKENKIPYPCLIGDDKTQEQIPDFEGFPTTLFLDRSGKVRLKVVGYHSYADLDAILTALLDEPKAAARP